VKETGINATGASGKRILLSEMPWPTLVEEQRQADSLRLAVSRSDTICMFVLLRIYATVRWIEYYVFVERRKMLQNKICNTIESE